MFKQFFWLIILALAVRSAPGFSLIGPVANGGDDWQAPELAYNPNRFIDPRPLGPKNIGEEYRRNRPVLYYSMDQNFYDFFGSNGVVAIDQAFAIFNQLALTNLSRYRADLSEFPLQAQRNNYQAQALTLTDVKSVVLSLLTEQVGLTSPERYIWTLHSREHFGGVPCPAGMEYFVVKRNFDPVPSSPSQFQYSSYVNGTLYSYQIIERCNTLGGDPRLAEAVEFSVDPLADTYTAIASGGLYTGSYYIGLTRDDVGGMRYLMRTNNLNIEAAGAGTVTLVTNYTVSQFLFTSNLTLFAEQALTNNAAALTALYPGLVILDSTSFFTNVVTTIVTYVFMNYPWDPAGTPPHLVPVKTLTTNITTHYQHQYANVVTNHPPTNGFVTVITPNTSTTFPVDSTGGDFFIIPNDLCGVSLISSQEVGLVYTTNTVTTADGTPVSTVSSFFQYSFVIHPVECLPNTVALRQGVERIRFERRDYDSLFNQFFEPITNEYILNAVTNNRVISQLVRRTVTEPDILFSASDLTAGPGAIEFFAVASSVQFDQGNILPGLAGPGTISGAGNTTITLNKVGPLYYNYSPGNLDEAGQLVAFIWGSFDGSTNLPVVYPNGTSIQDLENQIFIQVSPEGPALPDGAPGVDYTNAFSGFTVIGGSPPYAWSLTPGSPGLPLALVLHSGSGMISGVPQTPGQYDFVVRMTDVGGRFVDRPYSITITNAP